MKKRKNCRWQTVFGKFIAALLLLSFAAAYLTGCGADTAKPEQTAESEKTAGVQEQIPSARYEQLGRIYAEAMELDRTLGKDTPYARVYMVMETGKMMGKTEDDAFQSAKESVTLSRAVEWYAEKEGVSVSEQKVEDYMIECFAEMEKSEDFAEIDNAFRKSGITFREYYFQFPQIYRWQYIVKGPLAEDGKEADTDRIVKAYRETEDYDRLLLTLVACKEAWHEWGADGERLKNAEIYES